MCVSGQKGSKVTETLIVTYRYADGSKAEKGYSGDFAEAVDTAMDKKDAGEIVSYTVHRQASDAAVGA